MMIGQLQQGAGALAREDGNQSAHLVLGEAGDLGWWGGVLAWLHGSDSTTLVTISFTYMRSEADRVWRVSSRAPRDWYSGAVPVDTGYAS